MKIVLDTKGYEVLRVLVVEELLQLDTVDTVKKLIKDRISFNKNYLARDYYLEAKKNVLENLNKKFEQVFEESGADAVCEVKYHTEYFDISKDDFFAATVQALLLKKI